MKKFVVLALSSIVLASVSVVINATTEYPDGGQWHYGVGTTGSFSDYYHEHRKHSSTVTYGNESDKSIMNKGDWSKARLTRYHGCNFYYNVL